MRKILCFLMAMLVAFVLVTPAHAFLINRGIGTSTYGDYRLIYDTDLDITWYDFSKTVDTWSNQVVWANMLEVDFGGIIIDDWRLPTALNQDGSGPEFGFADGSEMGHLYYNDDALNIDGGGSLNNPDNFQNFLPAIYWSGTEFEANTSFAWT